MWEPVPRANPDASSRGGCRPTRRSLSSLSQPGLRLPQSLRSFAMTLLEHGTTSEKTLCPLRLFAASASLREGRRVRGEAQGSQSNILSFIQLVNAHSSSLPHNHCTASRYVGARIAGDYRIQSLRGPGPYKPSALFALRRHSREGGNPGIREAGLFLACAASSS